MPEPPPGEAELRDLAQRFVRAEGRVLAHLAEAATGHRRWNARQALEALAALRLLDFKQPVAVAYLAEHPKGKGEAVRDLAGSLAKRLDSGARTAADGVREAFTQVTSENLEELLASPLTAAVDARGTRWALGHWGDLNCITIGRQATSRGLAHRVGEGRHVTIDAGQCDLCRDQSGDAVIGQDPLPPYHPSCSCVATTA